MSDAFNDDGEGDSSSSCRRQNQEHIIATSQMSTLKRVKLINDPVHGHYELDEYLVKVIDTEHFQRLRDIIQLGASYHVFLGATHRRFEHSLGTSHLAKQMLKHLYEQQGEEIFENVRDYENAQEMTQLAALCHDLGHGPYSHLFDNEVLRIAKVRDSLPDDLPQLHHEARSVMMLNHLMDQYNLDYSKDQRRVIASMIDSPPANDSLSYLTYPFLYQIVANKASGLDVDKWDYLNRDTQNLGLRFGFDHRRLMQCSRVIDNNICFHQKEVFNIFDMYNLRFKLHKLVYNHRAAKAVEYMLSDVLIGCDKHFGLTSSITDPQEFMRFSDSLIRVVEMSKDASLEDSRKILRRLRDRDLYRFVDEFLVPANSPEVTEVDISTSQNGGGHVQLVPNDLIIQNMRANFGMRQQNPVDNIRFFKNLEDRASFHIGRDQVSYLLPTQFEEKTVRLFCKNPDPLYIEAAQAAFRKFMKKNRFAAHLPSPELDSLSHDNIAIPSQRQTPTAKRVRIETQEGI